ncbi:protein zntC-like isoform X1 [Venturia canescens]|uniref:protein zntC-like isoform X1 n=1 Tax=Venturia canescens TaxID=32260 RepID=UPI001C9BD74D|nr:protein zntC-like isoform X1 [Venturia canescens]
MENTPDSSTGSANTTLVLAKIGAMCVLGLGSLLLGMLPLLVGRCKFRNRDKCRAISSSNSSTSTNASTSIDSSSQGLLTSMLLCFGGGVLLFTTFLHLAPEVRQSVERHQSNGQLMSLGTLSMAELLFCIGFFLVYLVEETVHATLTSKPEASEDLLYRTVSVRRCNKQASTSLSTTTISTVTAPTSGSKSSSWRVGRFKYSDEKEDSGAEGKHASSGSSIGQEIDAKNTEALPALFVRSSNSVESSNEASSRIDRTSEAEKNFGARKKVPIVREPSNKADTSARGLLTVVALSFHAIFEGLAVGLEPSISSVLYLAAAIATHKLVIAFCVGMELYVAGASSKTLLGYLSVFSLVTPLGIGAGLALGHFKNDSENLGPTPTILQGMAAGTLLYVVFFEVLARERANDKSGLLQLLAIIVGFMLMLGLQLATAHSHSHSHGHSHGHGHSHHDNSHGGEDEHEKSGAHSHDEEHHNFDLSTSAAPLNKAIEKLAESVVETVTNVIASSTTASPKPYTRNTSDASTLRT